MRRLGQYELLRKIGSGGMAEVWMGRRPAMGGASKAVAIKLLAHHIADDPTYRQMFIDEARLSMLLTNSNVVQVFDVGEVAGECYMVMEWVDGLNLADLTRNMSAKGEGISIELAAHVIGETLRGLAYAHSLHHDGGSATIVHRDVSPQNVLCSVSGEVKLADFGVARLAREETSGLHVKGKLRYMAPEQLRGRSREPTVDLYAVGAMLHELLSGEKFRKGGDEADLYSMALSGEYPPLPSKVPVELAIVCKRLLEPDPTLRIQTAEQALELLARWPGYRNGAIELGRLVREYSGISGPRSGIVHFPPAPTTPAPASSTSATAATASIANSVDKTLANPVEPSVQTGTPTEIIAPRESGPIAGEQPNTAQTRTWTGSGSAEPMHRDTLTSASGPVLATTSSAPASGGSPSRWLLVGALVALVFGLFGLGTGLGWWGPRAEPIARASATEGDPTSVDPTGGDPTGGDLKVGDLKVGDATTGGVTTTTTSDPTTNDATASNATTGDATGDATTGDAKAGEATTGTDDDAADEGKAGEGTDSAGTSGGASPQPRERSNSPVDRTPAEVEFIANDFLFIYIKVAGIEAPLEPKKKLELKPGRHKVYLRKSDAEAWQPAGQIKVDAGKRYKVRMTKPAGVKLELIG